MKTISIIVPVYQNEENLPHTIPKLLSLREQLRGYSFELLFVDDGSTDGSFEELKKFQERNPDAIHLIRLSRNFGQTPAIQAGLRHASGNCVGIISADLQEPYQKFVDMVRIWEGGKKFIFGERVSREEKASHQFFSNLYWKMIRRFSMGNFPQAGYDFCLMDRQVVEDLNKINEKNTSIFALIFWLGYQPTALKIDRKLRKAGVSQWPLLKKIRITIDTIIGFTYLPLRFITLTAFIAAILAVLLLITTIIQWLFLGNPVEGWTTIVDLLLIFGSLILFSLGIIGEYLWRILDETRKRPPFIIETVVKPTSTKEP